MTSSPRWELFEMKETSGLILRRCFERRAEDSYRRAAVLRDSKHFVLPPNKSSKGLPISLASIVGFRCRNVKQQSIFIFWRAIRSDLSFGSVHYCSARRHQLTIWDTCSMSSWVSRLLLSRLIDTIFAFE